MLSQRQYNNALKSAIEECKIGDARTLNLTIKKVSEYNYDFVIQSNGVNVATGGHDFILGWFHIFEYLDKKYKGVNKKWKQNIEKRKITTILLQSKTKLKTHQTCLA